MNGRLYDPKLHRFIQPDDYVQEPYNSQNYNRYAYGLNNPLIYSDKSGKIFWLIPALIGGFGNWLANGAHFTWKGLGQFAVGALAGGVSAGIGNGINVAMANGSFVSGFLGTAQGVASTGFLSGAATGLGVGFANGFLSGIGNGLLDGKSFGDSFGEGISAGIKQGASGAAIGGLIGGIKSASKGLDFFTGEGDFDLSNGFGAHGNVPTEGSIRGKYVGNYHGADVYESSALKAQEGITLPGRGIHVSVGAYSQNLDPSLIRHEFGHILQGKLIGMGKYYDIVAPKSLGSAIKQNIVASYHHKNFWTEVWANNLSWEYFNDIPNALKNLPWNNLRFPLKWNSLDDFLRVRRIVLGRVF